jgi:hypothetical protein
MVWNAVEDKLESTLGKFSSGNSKTFPTSQVFVNHVLPHTIRRPYVVFCPEVGKSPTEVCKKALVLIRDGDARGAPFPDPHEPHGVNVQAGDGVPLLPGNLGQGYRPFVFLAQLLKPDPCIDFIDNRMFWP